MPRHAARTGEQTWHVVGPALIAAAALVASVVVPGDALKFACLCVAAAGIAAIDSVGNLGGFVAQNAVPWIKDRTGSDLVPMLFLAACLTAGALMVFAVQARLRPAGVPAPERSSNVAT